MSPVTHFLVGWAVANTMPLSKKDRALVTVGGIIPDADSLGVIIDILAPRPNLPFYLFGKYHHLLGHNLPFCLIYLLIAWLMAAKKWTVVLLAGLAFHLHLLCDVIGSASLAGQHWPMPYLWPFITDKFILDWKGMWEIHAWPNIALTLVLLVMTFYLAWRRGFSPLEMISKKADEAVVQRLRERFGFKEVA